MYDSKAYNKEYYQKNKEKLREDSRERMKKYRQTERGKAQTKKWREENKGYLKAYRQKNDGWWKAIHRKLQQKYRIKYPKKMKARNYANRNNQRGDICLICGNTENLHFHHIDYEQYDGFTVCESCHRNIHKNDKFTEVENDKTN